MFRKTKNLNKVENAGEGLRHKAGDVSKSRWRGGRYKMVNSVWDVLKLRCCGQAMGDSRHNNRHSPSSRTQESSIQEGALDGTHIWGAITFKT